MSKSPESTIHSKKMRFVSDLVQKKLGPGFIKKVPEWTWHIFTYALGRVLGLHQVTSLDLRLNWTEPTSLGNAM